MRKGIVLLLALLVTGLCACTGNAGGTGGGVSPTPTSAAVPAGTEVPPVEQQTPTALQARSPWLQRQIDWAVTEMASDLGVPESEIEIVSVEEISWDEAVGAPPPEPSPLGPGYRIVLRSSGREEVYMPFPAPTVLSTHGVATPYSTKDIHDASPWMPIEPVQPQPSLQAPAN
jgi:hypothetical protein